MDNIYSIRCDCGRRFKTRLPFFCSCGGEAKLHNGKPLVFSSKAPNKPCKHLGNFLYKKSCETCNGNKTLRFFECDIYKDVTLEECRVCGDYKCVHCNFDGNGKCTVCGFQLEVNELTKISNTITRECGPDNSKESMPTLRDGQGTPYFLKNGFSGRKDNAIFFIGGGPSLLNQDLELLNNRHITTFAVNNVAAKTVKPTMWTGCDEPKSFHDIIWDDPTIMKFFPMEKSHKHYYVGEDKQNSRSPVRNCPNVYLYSLIGDHWNHETFLDEEKVSWGCDAGIEDSLGNKGHRSVMLPAFYLMVYLGFKRIYLLGCDFNMQYDETGHGQGLTYAFPQWKHKAGCDSNNSCFKVLNERFKVLRPILEKKGVTVKNCTPDSNLTAFDFEDYETAILRESYINKVKTHGMYG